MAWSFYIHIDFFPYHLTVSNNYNSILHPLLHSQQRRFRIHQLSAACSAKTLKNSSCSVCLEIPRLSSVSPTNTKPSQQNLWVLHHSRHYQFVGKPTYKFFCPWNCSVLNQSFSNRIHQQLEINLFPHPWRMSFSLKAQSWPYPKPSDSRADSKKRHWQEEAFSQGSNLTQISDLPWILAKV